MHELIKVMYFKLMLEVGLRRWLSDLLWAGGEFVTQVLKTKQTWVDKYKHALVFQNILNPILTISAHFKVHPINDRPMLKQQEAPD